MTAVADTLTALHASVATSHPLVVAGVGSGLAARGAAEGGADLIMTYSTAVMRAMGLPSALSFLPYGDANALSFAVLPEILAAAPDSAVLVGLGAHDPRQPHSALIDKVASAGAIGVTNEPFVGMYGDAIRSELERAGLGFQREVKLIGEAVARGMLALGWAFDAEEARALADAGAQLVGAMLGPSLFGSHDGLDDAARNAEAIAEAALAVAPDALILVHGGPVTSQEAVSSVLRRHGLHGYVTGSSAERQPVIAAVAAAVRSYKELGPTGA